MADDARGLYATALQNTHALELQALQIMERQVERLRHYPEMEQALRQHIAETHGQRDRLEEAMQAEGTAPSAIKEGVLGFVGNMAALAHTPAPDEILKNAFANRAFENFEAAAYESLLVFAEAAGAGRFTAGFRKSLDEEVAMAQRVADMVPTLTQRYITLSLQGAKADR
jgi:ferritin-like metal-binding protein YciE